MERSSEFIAGYNACKVGISRTHNPHDFLKGGEANKYQDWYDGWNTCFHGESIYEGTPDP